MSRREGFTLIELLIAIAITAIIGLAVYFSLVTALDVWVYSSDELALQKVASEVTDAMVNGPAAGYGIRHSLEFKECRKYRVEFVPPWIDDTHRSEFETYSYLLNKEKKPGTAAPLADYQPPGQKSYKFITVEEIDREEKNVSAVRLPYSLPAGSRLRFIYHPNEKDYPDAIKTFWWDSQDKQVYSEYKGQIDNISQNPFGVEIIDLELNYYNDKNELVTEFDRVDRESLKLITGVEIRMEAELKGKKLELLNFVSVPNAPLHSGYFTVTDETKIPIPDSQNIHTFMLDNFSGVSSGDVLIIDALGKQGKSWRIEIKFKRVGLGQPRIESYSIEYPIGTEVYSQPQAISIKGGLDLLSLGPNGLYDYDDDQDMEDIAVLKGDVVLKVNKIDIKGVGIFIRP